MPLTRTRKYIKARERTTGEIGEFITPPGVSAPPGTSGHFLAWFYARYGGGATLLNCTTNTPAPAGAPVWNWTNANIPVPIPGTTYTLRVPRSALTAGGSEHITVTGVRSAPAWLYAFYEENGLEVILTGTVPLSGSLNLTLFGQQSGSAALATDKDFSVPIATASLYAYYVYRAATNKLTLYVGGDGTGSPATQMLLAPAAFTDRASYSMNRLAQADQVIGGQPEPYFFSFTYGGIVTGQYDNKINWLGQDVYVSLTVIAGASDAGVLILSTVAPTAPAIGLPFADGEAEAIINHAPTREVATGFLTCDYGLSFSKTFPATMFADQDNDTLTWDLQYSTDGGATYGALPGWCSFTAATRTWTGLSTQTANTYFRKVVTDGNGGVAYDPFFLITNQTS